MNCEDEVEQMMAERKSRRIIYNNQSVGDDEVAAACRNGAVAG